jgi:hypothetical protein
MTTEIKRPEPGSLGSPFESIRSSEIIPIFQRWFTIEWKLEFSAFLHLIVPPGTRAVHLENCRPLASLKVSAQTTLM